MAAHRRKLRAAILYFLHHANNDHLGRTKLMKLLYFLDAEHVRAYRLTVTGAEYRKLPYGPVALEALAELDRLEEEGLIVKEVRGLHHAQQVRYHPVQDPAPLALGPTELEIAKVVCCRWRNASMDEIVDASHAEFPWTEVADNQVIPMRLALHGNDPVFPTAAQRDAAIRSIIASQGLEGVKITYEEAAQAFDRAYERPIADIG